MHLPLKSELLALKKKRGAGQDGQGPPGRRVGFSASAAVMTRGALLEVPVQTRAGKGLPAGQSQPGQPPRQHQLPPLPCICFDFKLYLHSSLLSFCFRRPVSPFHLARTHAQTTLQLDPQRTRLPLLLINHPQPRCESSRRGSSPSPFHGTALLLLLTDE